MRLNTCFSFVFLLFGSLTVTAQVRSINFSANELETKSHELTGDSLNWPVLVSISDYNPTENRFYISHVQLQKLHPFKSIHSDILSAQKKLPTVVKSGAKIFANTELDEFQSKLQNYRELIKVGQLDPVLQFASVVIQSFSQLEKSLKNNRLADIEAKLSEKTGTVDKRKGLLGNWNDANEGDLFFKQDGIKTGDKSLAKMIFLDGSNFTLEGNSIAVIRSSQLDKLNQSVQGDVRLVKGSLLAKLSTQAQQEETFQLQVAGTRSDLQSGNFWASVNNDSTVQLSNYDGSIRTRTQQAQVILKKNQGTIVVKGKPPTPPVDLLPSPKLNFHRNDTVIFQPELLVAWSPIQKATSYQIQISRNREFSIETKTYSTKETYYKLSGLLAGTYYLRVYPFDMLGLRGVESSIYRLIRNEDKVPPIIQLPERYNQTIYLETNNLTFNGLTEPGSTLLIDSKPIVVTEQGQFTFTKKISDPVGQFHILATDRAGNENKKLISYVLMTFKSKELIRSNIPIVGDLIQSGNTLISFAGKAYPGLKVKLSWNNQFAEIPTDINGNWGYTFKEPFTGTIIINFNTSENTNLHTLTYRIEK